MTGILILINANKSEEEKKKSGTASSGVLGLVMMIWGAVELWDVPCADELKGTLIYTMTEINTIIGIVSCGICVVLMFGMCGVMCCKGNR